MSHINKEKVKQKKQSTKEISVPLKVQKELLPLTKEAMDLRIVDAPSLRVATSLLSRLNRINDLIEQESNKVLIPLKEAQKAEKARWEPALTSYKAGIEALRLKQTIYQTNLVNARKSKQEAITARIHAGKGGITLETAVKKLESLSSIDTTIETNEGTVKFRESKQLKIIDLSQIPELYWQVNEELLLEDLKAGHTIPGAGLEVIQVPVNYR